MNSVFLTGATETIGSAILETLAAHGGYSVDCLAKRPESRDDIERYGGRVVMGDLADEGCFRAMAAARDYDFVIHAAQARFGEHAPGAIGAIDRSAVAKLERLRSGRTKLMV